ncbi:hypothetical protein POBR111598_09995 [Polynucleobacter brandtiae]
MPVKVFPSNASSAAVISNVEVPASLVMPTLITLVIVVGFRINVPVPAIAADQFISFAVKLKLPIPLKADAIDIVPVPAFNVSDLPAPEIAVELAIVILALLALVLIVKPAPRLIAVFTSPNVMLPPVKALVMTVPPKLIEDGADSANAPPE